jgi:hypothetical protein
MPCKINLAGRFLIPPFPGSNPVGASGDLPEKAPTFRALARDDRSPAPTNSNFRAEKREIRPAVSDREFAISVFAARGGQRLFCSTLRPGFDNGLERLVMPRSLSSHFSNFRFCSARRTRDSLFYTETRFDNGRSRPSSGTRVATSAPSHGPGGTMAAVAGHATPLIQRKASLLRALQTECRAGRQGDDIRLSMPSHGAERAGLGSRWCRGRTRDLRRHDLHRLWPSALCEPSNPQVLCQQLFEKRD